MNDRERDDLDRLIDEAAVSMVRAEPRRVTAASVRIALETRSAARSTFPVWLAVAALLVVGFLLAINAPKNDAPARRALAVPSPTQRVAPPAATPITETNTLVAVSETRVASPVRSSRIATSHAAREVYEGLPRLTIEPIEFRDEVPPIVIDDGPLRIPRIEIAPLALATLTTNDQEH